MKCSTRVLPLAAIKRKTQRFGDQTLTITRRSNGGSSRFGPQVILKDAKTIVFGPPAPTLPQNPLIYNFPRSQTLNLDGELLGKCLAAETILSGQPYYFSKDEMISPFNSSKFEAYVRAVGEFGWGHAGAADLYKTGKEEKLKGWINAQPDNSVDPIHLYVASLKINSGNVWNALLAIHDLLRNNARFYHSNRYNYSDSLDNVDHLFNKLIDIRGDLKERGAGFKGEHSGSWYRIWALLLIAHSDQRNKSSRSIASLQGEKCDLANPPLSKLRSFISSSRMELVARQAREMEQGKARANYESDAVGKVKIDTNAAKSGAEMSIDLWLKPMSVTEAKRIKLKCEAREYLKLE